MPAPKPASPLSTASPQDIPRAAASGKQLDPGDLLNGCALGYGQQLARLWAAQADALSAESAGDPDTLTRALAMLRAEEMVTDRLFDMLAAAARAAAPTVVRR